MTSWTQPWPNVGGWELILGRSILRSQHHDRLNHLLDVDHNMFIYINMLTIAMNSSRISWYSGPSISVTILITDPSARGGRYAYARSTNARYKGVLNIWDWVWKEWLFVSLIETEDIVPGRMPPVRTIEKEWAGRGGPMPGGFILELWNRKVGKSGKV